MTKTYLPQPSGSVKTRKPRFYYGFFIVFASFMVLMVTGGVQSSFGVFFKPMLTEFGWSRALTAGAFSINLAMQGIISFIAGRLNDRFGPRVLVTVAGILLGSGFLLLSQTESIWQIYLFYGVLVGIGSGTWVPLLSTQMRWFFKHRGIVSGIVSSGIGAGIMIGPLLATELIASYNWRVSFFVIGLLALIVIVIAAQLLKRDPSDIKEPDCGADTSDLKSPNMAVQGLSLQEAIRTPNFWIIGMAYFSLNFSLQTVLVHIVPHATDIGITADTAATILSVLGILSIIARLGVGRAIDRIGCKSVTLAVMILLSAAFLWLLLTDRLWMFYLFAIIYAFGYGGASALQSPLVADCFGLRSHGTILGVVLIGNFLGGAIGPLIAGRIFDMSGNYNWAFSICSVLSIIVVAIAPLLKPIVPSGKR